MRDFKDRLGWSKQGREELAEFLEWAPCHDIVVRCPHHKVRRPVADNAEA